jgi:hypothetical protein
VGELKSQTLITSSFELLMTAGIFVAGYGFFRLSYAAGLIFAGAACTVIGLLGAAATKRGER